MLPPPLPYSHPLCYFPCFYLMKGWMEKRPLGNTLNKCRTEMWENLKSLWMVWVPFQIINFSVVPLHLRIPYGKEGLPLPPHVHAGSAPPCLTSIVLILTGIMLRVASRASALATTLQ